MNKNDQYKEYTEEDLRSCRYVDEGKRLVGNWKKFQNFGWTHSGDEDADNLYIHYIATRDSTLLAESNCAVTKRMLAAEHINQDDYRFEDHGHWGYGWAEAVVVKVFADAEKKTVVTPAFAVLVDIANSLADYPILDESDYSEREYDASCDNIRDIGIRWMSRNDDFQLKEEFENDADKWVSAVFSWLWENKNGEMENVDDGGANPSEESVGEALIAVNK